MLPLHYPNFVLALDARVRIERTLMVLQTSHYPAMSRAINEVHWIRTNMQDFKSLSFQLDDYLIVCSVEFESTLAAPQVSVLTANTKSTVDKVGFEPITSWLKATCSTQVELTVHRIEYLFHLTGHLQFQWTELKVMPSVSLSSVC